MLRFEISYEEGKKYFENAIKTWGDNPIIFHAYSMSLQYRRLYEQASNILKKGLESNQESVLLITAYAENLVKQSRELDAIELLFKKTKQNETEPLFYIRLAEILVSMNKKDLALDFYRMGIKKCPSSISLLEKYGAIVSEMKQYDEAMFIYLRLTAEKPNDSTYWSLLGNQYFVLSLNNLAFEAYKKANDLADGKEGWILANIGNLLNNIGIHTEGISYFNQALSIEPNSQYSHERLAMAIKSSDKQLEKQNEIEKEVSKNISKYKSLDEIIKTLRNESSQLISGVDG